MYIFIWFALVAFNLNFECGIQYLTGGLAKGKTGFPSKFELHINIAQDQYQ